MSLRKPMNLTRSSRPRRFTCSRAGSSRGPSPASTRVKGTLEISVRRFTESIRYLCPLSSAKREAQSITKSSSASPSSARRVDEARSPAQAAGSTALKITVIRSPLQPLATSCSLPRLHTAIIWSCRLSIQRLEIRVTASLAMTKWLVYTTRIFLLKRLASSAV